jgi:uncharacterized membrane protein YkoI
MRYLAAVLLLALAAGVSADQEAAFELAREGKIQPLSKLLERQQRLRPGRVLEVEFEQDGDHMIYEMEVLDAQGTVWELRFDAASGELLHEGLED